MRTWSQQRLSWQDNPVSESSDWDGLQSPKPSTGRGWSLAWAILTQPSTHLSFLASRGDFLEDSVGLRPSLEAQRKGEKLSATPAHSGNLDPGPSASPIPEPQQPQAASKASPGLAVPGRAWRDAQGIFWQVPFRAGIGRAALGGGGMRVTLAGLPGDRGSRGQTSSVCPNRPNPRNNSF